MFDICLAVVPGGTLGQCCEKIPHVLTAASPPRLSLSAILSRQRAAVTTEASSSTVLIWARYRGLNPECEMPSTLKNKTTV